MFSSHSALKTHASLEVLINGRLVGRLEKAADGAISFQYGGGWLAWEHCFADFYCRRP